MKIKIFIIILIISAVGLGIFLRRPAVAPVTPVVTFAVPSPAVPDAPKEIKYDRSTDLKKELEEINPQVLDSDF
jgi:hypothetical protein